MSYKKKYKKLLKAHQENSKNFYETSYKLLTTELENEGLKAENDRLNALLKQQAVLN